MKNFGLLAVALLVLTGCAAQPTAPAAPQPLMGTASTASAEPTASATAEPTSAPPAEPVESAYPGADEATYLENARASWQGGAIPSNDELLEVGYYRCAQSPEEHFEQQDNFWPDWSGSNNMTLGFLALTHLCPAD